MFIIHLNFYKKPKCCVQGFWLRWLNVMPHETAFQPGPRLHLQYLVLYCHLAAASTCSLVLLEMFCITGIQGGIRPTAATF